MKSTIQSKYFAKARLLAESWSKGFFIAILLPVTAIAADGYVQPVVDVRLEYNDNHRLASDKAQEISEGGATVNAKLNMGMRSPTSDVRFTPRIVTTMYPDEDQLETTDYYLTFFAIKRSQLTTWNLVTTYSDQSVLNSEQPGADFDDPDIGDESGDESGVSLVDNNRQKLVIRPSVSRKFGQRMTAKLGLNIQDSTYDNAISGIQTNYDFQSVELEFERRMSERDRLSLTAVVSTYEADSGNETDGTGLFGSWSRSLSSQSSLSFWLGLQESDVEGIDVLGMPTRSSSETTTLYGLAWSRSTEVSDLRFSLSQRVNPNASGFQVQRSEIRVNYRRQLKDRLRGRLGARFSSDEGIGDPLNLFNDRDYMRLEAEISWDWTPTWTLVAQYRYTRQDRERFVTEGSSNAISVGIRYTGLVER